MILQKLELSRLILLFLAIAVSLGSIFQKCFFETVLINFEEISFLIA